MIRKPPEMGRWVGATAALALVLSGCGGAKRTAPPQPPALPHALASDLAATSDAVASALAAGDSCQALSLAQRLQGQTITAINTHRVPAGLQEQLSGAVNALVAGVTCVPPPPPTTTDEDHRGKDKGHGKHGKRGDEG
jgi:hypothetical protein